MNTSIPQKRCAKCNAVLPATREYFWASSQIRDGLQSYCKACSRKSSSKYPSTERNRRYRQNSPDKSHERNHRWYEKNKRRAIEITRRYRQSHPEKTRQWDQRRRAQKAQLEATLTHPEWEQILASYGFACAYCGKSWLDCKLEQEHVIPVTQGGGYTKDNIVPACKSCNSKKGDRTPEQAGMKLRPKLTL